MTRAIPITILLLLSLTLSSQDWHWETLDAVNEPVARHEAGLVAIDSNIILLGGRRINPTSVYDLRTNTWTDKAAPPLEIHHFQPVVIDNAVYILGAMTGPWPNETPLDRVLIYHPDRDEYIFSHEIPAHRRRGGAGAAVYNGKIYLIGGITNGHMNGYKPWLDVYDPQTGEWEVLDNAPLSRDHFQAVICDDKLFAFAGRRSSRSTDEDMSLTVGYGNVYDLKSNNWHATTERMKLPTERAGNAAFVWKDEIVVGGGESMTQVAAHAEVEAFNSQRESWTQWPSMNFGRHGTGYAIIGGHVYTASGCGKRGGEPELTSLERLKLPSETHEAQPSSDPTRIHTQWETITIDFRGPMTSEDAEDNPFLNYALTVEFKHPDTTYRIRGYYAGDGNAASSGADSGNIWQARFTPDRSGPWKYQATLRQGTNIAIASSSADSRSIEIQPSTGDFMVIDSDKEAPSLRADGRILTENGYFYQQGSGLPWLKVGANSPENLLGFEDFDDTYRMIAEAREGEAATDTSLHRYAPHIADWQPGDPTWKENKGKALIGAINYLASKGMNAIYFLTMNIQGDGKDVWPYRSPDDFTRFDVSKLDQWEIVFQHMQSKGILLHIVLQETENELLHDNGDTGPMRKLYYNELIARFGHHLGLVWNVGEENGPASWSPNAQNHDQRKAMIQYLDEADPYNHPILLHTHSYEPVRSDVLDPLLGFEALDGLSLQVDKREEAPEVLDYWRKKSAEHGNEWLITMDEIGMWHTGALPDELDPEHPSLRSDVLWGTLLSGAAGVEWYFGGNYRQNDLNSEDWRERDRLWTLTEYAHKFFVAHLPYSEMAPAHHLLTSEKSYCFTKLNNVYALYFPASADKTIDLTNATGQFKIFWYDPLEGGELIQGTMKTIKGGDTRSLGTPPSSFNSDQDWVVLLRR